MCALMLKGQTCDLDRVGSSAATVVAQPILAIFIRGVGHDSVLARQMLAACQFLPLGDLQVIQGGAFAVNHYRSRVEQLLPSTVVGGEATHHAQREEKTPPASGLLGAIAKADHTLLKSTPSKSTSGEK